MIEFIMGVVMSPFILGAFVLFSIIAEAGTPRRGDWSGWAEFWAVLLVFFGFLHLKHGTVPVAITLVNVAVFIVAYAVIGFLWSFWRYRCFVVDSIVDFKQRNHGADEGRIQELKNRTSPSQNMGFILHNIVLFPITFLAYALEDIIRGLSAFVRAYLIGVYRTIQNKLFRDLYK